MEEGDCINKKKQVSSYILNENLETLNDIGSVLLRAGDEPDRVKQAEEIKENSEEEEKDDQEATPEDFLKMVKIERGETLRK